MKLPSLDDLFLIVPAFMIGTVLGSLVGLGLGGEEASLEHGRRAVIRAAAGSAAGALIYLGTAFWWPPIVGPFLTCPAAAMATSLLFTRKSA